MMLGVSEPLRPPIAWRWLGLLTAAFAVLEIATSDRYGYHRDELYCITISGHPAFGYVDGPPLVPLLAHALDAISGHSLVWLRVPAALAGALVVLVTGLIAREFGGGPGEQLLAAGAMAASGLTLGTSHMMSTTTFDLLAWTVLLWLVVRALREPPHEIAPQRTLHDFVGNPGAGPVWLLVGLVA